MEVAPSIGRTRVPIRRNYGRIYILYRTVFEIKRDIGRKRQFFIPHFHLTCTITWNLLEFSKNFLVQTAQFPVLVGGGKNIAEKFNLQGATLQTTERRQTDGSCHKTNVT